MASNDAVDKARSLLEDRRRELTAELAQIEQALTGLGAGKRRGPGRPRGSTTTTKGGKRRRRRRGGTRADHAVKHLEKNPGATAAEIATAMGIKPNYVYRVMSELEKDGRVRKDGKGYQLASAAASS
jgi:predicted Rossmann fold nucleotide-binding protein DprA/Smf involved in DNA uptake